jgi:glycosyltransferase involved in cell wall biosynthesis
MKKILFIQVGVGFLHVNAKLTRELKKHYPHHEIELFDVLPPVKRNLKVVLVNALVILKEYFFDFVRGRKSISSFRYQFLGTSYLFNYLSDVIERKIREGNYDFVIQTQCLCDAGRTPVPNYIYTDHTTLNNLLYRYVSAYKYMRSRQYIEVEKKAYNNATLIFVMSENIKNSLVQQYQIPAEKVKLVYVGSNTEVPATSDRTKYGNRNIIFVGKDWERKGGPVLIEAFKRVLTEIPDATLSILGCRPNVDVPNCTVYGELSLKEVAEHYQKASVFCLPTLREPFGIVFIEAMFNKLPIVTNNMGAAPYLVTERNGYRLENKVEEYTSALIQLLNDPARCEALGEESFRIASELYTWSNVATLMAKYINNDKGDSYSNEPLKLENSLT